MKKNWKILVEKKFQIKFAYKTHPPILPEKSASYTRKSTVIKYMYMYKHVIWNTRVEYKVGFGLLYQS